MDESRGKTRKPRDWRLDALGWDGGLPLLVALTPEVLLLCMADRRMAGLIAVILVPLVAALFRAHRGDGQIKAICPGELALGRQLVLAMAIILLLVFEGMLAALQVERVADPLAWLVAAAMYLVYLGLIAVALRPRGEENQGRDEDRR